MSYRSKPIDGGHVDFIFFHFLSEPDSLLDLGWVDVLRPASFCVVHSTALSFISFCVHLVLEDRRT